MKLIVYIVGHLTDLYKVVFLIHTSCWNSVLRVQSSQLLELPGNMHTTRHTQSSNYLVCNRSQVEDRLKSNPAVAIAGVLNPGSLFFMCISNLPNSDSDWPVSKYGLKHGHHTALFTSPHCAKHCTVLRESRRIGA